MKLFKTDARGNGIVKAVRTPTVLQMEAVECGAASLGMILGYYGRHVPLEELRVACGVTRDGSSAGNLLRAARSYGLEARGYKYEIDELRKLAPPFVIFWKFYHFVVVEGFTTDGAVLNDPAGGRRVCDWEEFDRAYTGVCLTFSPGPEFTPSNEVPATTSILRRQLAGSWGGVLFVILAGLALVVPNIALPTFTKTFIDEVMVGKSYGWVFWIAVGIAGSIALRMALLELQQRAILHLQAKLALANASRMLWHCLHLPMTFFAQRSPAEVANRVAICDRIAELLSSRLAESAIGVVAALFYLALMARYDRFLAAVSLGIAALNILALRIVARHRSDANAAVLQEEAMLGYLGFGARTHRNAEIGRRREHVLHEMARASGESHQCAAALCGAFASAQCRAAPPHHDQHNGDPDARRITRYRRRDLGRDALCVRALDAAFHRSLHGVRGAGRRRAGDGRRCPAHRRRPTLSARSAAYHATSRAHSPRGRARAARGFLRLQQTRATRRARHLVRYRAGAAHRARRSFGQWKIDDR